ncbi:hypothetical protein K458DRAFT_22321 [Lentithecium fluviatile CBS 122367]|uniref:Uncharacterized protein n=1 Tax=Lentithecium fluviatile CBS 122367 TaxID=1168545 RepID=A0A6G1J443_9PLEO|nr:hypothetical protein K458DRAFT_22321 [Lentithecium fluviatile CBS 122367]
MSGFWRCRCFWFLYNGWCSRCSSLLDTMIGFLFLLLGMFGIFSSYLALFCGLISSIFCPAACLRYLCNAIVSNTLRSGAVLTFGALVSHSVRVMGASRTP